MIGPPFEGGFAPDAKAGADDGMGAAPFTAHGPVQAGNGGSGPAQALGIEQVVGAGVVLVHGALDEAHAENLRVEGVVARRVGGDGGQVMDAGESGDHGGGLAPLRGGISASVAAQFAAPIGVAAALGRSESTGFDLALWDPRLTQAGLAGVAVVLIVQALVVALVAWVRGWKPASPVVAATLVTATGLWLVAVGMTLALSQSIAMAAILAGAAIAAAVAAALPQLKTPGASLAAGASAAAALGAWMAPAPPEVSFTIWVAVGAAAVLVVSLLLPSRCSAGVATTGAVALLGTCWVLVAAGVQAVVRLTELVDGNPVTADPTPGYSCLLYTSGAAGERSSVDLGGRRIIKKKKKINTLHHCGYQS